MALNKHLVSSNGEDVLIMNPPQRLTKDEAVEFAAWLVAVAGADEKEFNAKFQEVCS